MSKEAKDFVNTGEGNTGDNNTGSYNTGDRNTGDMNTGSYNTGDRNSGTRNSGIQNSGNRNTGNQNSGNRNTGDRNSGDCNSGNRNSGECNSGNNNAGNNNSGDWNSGNRNSGDWNNTNFSNGCFNTVEPTIYLFNKPSGWTYRDWLNSEAHNLMNRIKGGLLEFVYLPDMTDEEKAAHPEAETTGGYLKELDNSECAVIWWRSLDQRQKNVIMSIPNFDMDIFKKITGIKDIEDPEPKTKTTSKLKSIFFG